NGFYVYPKRCRASEQLLFMVDFMNEQKGLVWRDLKSRTSNKVRDRKRQQALTGNNPLTCRPINRGGKTTKKYPKSPSIITPHRPSKRKRSNEEDVQEKFLEIAKQQADSLRLLAETNAANTECTKKMAEAIVILAEGLKHVGDAFNNLAQSINRL
ncbi:hypothetical protein EVAR_72428_1, partial [Eumeta japonica]